MAVVCSLVCLCGCAGRKASSSNWHASCALCGAPCYDTQQSGLAPMTRQNYVALLRGNELMDTQGRVFCPVCRGGGSVGRASTTGGGVKEVSVPDGEETSPLTIGRPP